jgi:peptidoglycan hydrolase-like protein with peptidoglycan-binding domain
MMKRVRPFLAAAAALAVVSGGAVLPVLSSAALASAQASCNGTSLKPALDGGSVRVPTLGNGTGNTNCDLGIGNAGQAVARLQIALRYCNNDDTTVAVDSNYGPLTSEAVLDVQQTYGLPDQDGIFGPQTSNAMLWPVSGQPLGVCDLWI